MVRKLSFLIILLMIFSPVVVRAEGSKELTQYGGSRPFLDDRTDFFNGIPRKSTIKVYVRAGEVLQLGSSAVGVGPSGNIIATAPNGDVLNCKTSQPGKGFIANRAQELAGPDNPGGFTPCETTVTAAQEGIWEIRFVAPNPGTQDPTTIAANGSWPAQGTNNSFVTAWDVTVRNSGVVQPGRAFANSLALNTNLPIVGGSPQLNNLPPVNSQFFVQTQDGYLYNVNLNGLEPVGFIFFSNKNGFIDSSGNPKYKSVEAPTAATGLTQDPADDNFTNKLFFNQPDPSLPTTANSPSGTTWLNPVTVAPPKPSNLKFVGKEGTENQTGTNPLQGNFTFVAPQVRPYTISIDINDNGSFTDPIDRIIIGTATVGLNTVPWDGKDGQGNDILPNALGYRVQVKLYGGEVHFPLLDPERNPNGLIINRITPVTGVSGDPTYNPDWVYYDDSDFTNRPGIAPNPIKLLTGGPSSGGIRSFLGAPPGNPQTNANGWWGDKRGIDTWTFFPSEPVEPEGRIRVLQADLSINKTLTTTPPLVAGGEISYTITVSNAGPSDVTGVGVTDTFPTQIVNPTWTCAITMGTGDCPTPSGSGNIDTTVNLNAGAVATFTVTAELAPTATAPITNSATVTRPNDVADPVDQDNSGGDNKTETSTANYTAAIPDNPVLGIAKQAGTVTPNLDGSFSIPYTLRVVNSGNVALNNVQVTEDLKATFGDSLFTIVPGSLNSPDGLTVNPNFNGDGDKNLLTGGDTLPAPVAPATSVTRTIQFTVRVTPRTSLPAYQNTAQVSGTTPGGTVVTDDSTDGDNPDPDGNGNPSDNSVPTVVNFEVPRLGVAKAAGTPVNNNDGSYTIPYTLVVKNMGNVAINSLQVSDDLSTTFGTVPFEVVPGSINSPTGLSVNTSYTGSSPNQNLLLGTDNLPVGATAEIKFDVRITPGTNLGPFNNTATANGTSPGGATVTDNSTDGSNPDPDGDGNPGNNSSPTSVQISGNSNLRLVKRVTRINQTPLTGVVDVPTDPNDDSGLSWPANYLQGQTNVPDVLPGDEVEYTIYFLSDGNVSANDVKICDRIPENQTFVPDHFAVGRGSAVQFGTNTPTFLTNANDSDSGAFFPVGTPIDVNLCSGSNTNGALIWNLGNIPSSTNPINYGFVRFRAKVK